MRRVEVPAARLAGWVERFTARHGALAFDAAGDTVALTAADGSRAVCTMPFPPTPGGEGWVAVDCVGALMTHVLLSRRLGVLLVRLGGAAVAIAETGPGPARLVASKMARRHVQGRSAAGGWSQQRFARRRAGQARNAYEAAADAAAILLAPAARDLAGLVTGGDRKAVAAVLADQRLAVLRPLVTPHVLDVPDPRQAVLEAALERLTAVRILVSDPTDGSAHA